MIIFIRLQRKHLTVVIKNDVNVDKIKFTSIVNGSTNDKPAILLNMCFTI